MSNSQGGREITAVSFTHEAGFPLPRNGSSRCLPATQNAWSVLIIGDRKSRNHVWDLVVGENSSILASPLGFLPSLDQPIRPGEHLRWNRQTDLPRRAQTACQRKPTEPLALSSSERCDLEHFAHHRALRCPSRPKRHRQFQSILR
jgi:hypothetical protein